MSESQRDIGRRHAARRYLSENQASNAGPASNDGSATATPAAQREWQMTDLLDSPRLLGRAEADARYSGNRSARQALNELRTVIATLAADAEHD